MDRNKVGVIGAGQMGTGIAEVCAGLGFDVYLMDVKTKSLQRRSSNSIEADFRNWSRRGG